MGSRERKRAELQRRKERSASRIPVGSTPETGAPAEPGTEPQPRLSRSEQKNQEAREALVPLGEGERPLVVTIGAAISALLALSVIGAYLAGAEVDGEKPPLIQVIVPTALMSLMAWGMWRARYWAVLGFQTLLLLLILATSLGLVQATEAPQIAGNLAILAIASALFYFMIKALARIQMPGSDPPGGE
jgi:hypothetical protein